MIFPVNYNSILESHPDLSAPASSLVSSTAASPPSRFLFRWLTTRAVSVWLSWTWTMHHTTGTSLRVCRSFVLELYIAVQRSQVKLNTAWQDVTAAADTHTYCVLVGSGWVVTTWFIVHSPKTKLSGLNSCPNGPERTESMVPGSRSTRMARGTNLLPFGWKRAEG